MKALLLTALILVAYSECHATPLDDSLRQQQLDYQRQTEQIQENNRYWQLQAQQQQILQNQEDMKRQMTWEAEAQKRAADDAWWDNFNKHAGGN